MERRKFIVGMGSLAAGGAAAMGSGAFSFAQTDRGIEMDVVSDDDAFLAIKPGKENGDYADVSSGKIAFNYTDAADVPGDGLNPDSVYLFDDIATIKNQGSQPIELSVPDTTNNGFWSTNFVGYVQDTSSSRRESIWPKDGNTSNFDERLNDRTNVEDLDDLVYTSTDSVELPVGEKVLLGMAFAAGDEGQSKSTEMTIQAST